MRSRHRAAECRLDRWSSCIRSMSDLGQSAVLTVRRPLPAFPISRPFQGSARARQGPAQGDATINSNYRHSDSAPIHPVARSILRTGTPEPRIKLLLLEMGH
jgi:hypothetical protein